MAEKKEHLIEGLKKTLGHSESTSLELESENVRLHETIKNKEKEAKHVNKNGQNGNFKVDQVTTATQMEKGVKDKCRQCDDEVQGNTDMNEHIEKVSTTSNVSAITCNKCEFICTEKQRLKDSIL